MTEPPHLATIDFLTHSKVEIAADAATIWPRIVDLHGWRSGQQLVPVDGEPGQVGECFRAVPPDAPDTTLFHVENVELIPDTRRTIRLTALDGSFMGFASWELTPGGMATIVAYDVYCRGAMLPPGQSSATLLAGAQQMMDEGLLRLKTFIEGEARPEQPRHVSG